STDVDTHANGTELLRHKAFLVVGHDEYWSKEMRDAVEFARDSGVNLALFAANTSYTQIRYESSSAGVPNRVVVEYRNLPWAPTAAWVFDAGTLAWSWGLDQVPGILSQGKVDPRIQQTTANILNTFSNSTAPPAPTTTGFTPTSGRVGANVTINGTNFTGVTA